MTPYKRTKRKTESGTPVLWILLKNWNKNYIIGRKNNMYERTYKQIKDTADHVAGRLCINKDHKHLDGATTISCLEQSSFDTSPFYANPIIVK